MASLNGLRVMVVDDEQMTRLLVRDLLLKFGVHHVMLTESAVEALPQIRTIGPDMLLTDWAMTPMDGLELTKRVRREPDPTLRRIPIILFSAHISRERVMKARNAGASLVMVKPFTMDSLRRHVLLALGDTRTFIESPGYVGPDRRVRDLQFEGPDRRRH